MGGQQLSAYARIDYVDGKAKDTERRINAFREDYRKLCSILDSRDRKMDERMDTFEKKLASHNAVISSLQTILSGVVANRDPDGQKSVSAEQGNGGNWIHMSEAVKICRSKYGMRFPYSEISRALVWAGILERKSTLNDNGYIYSILKKGTKLNLVSQDPKNKGGFLINAEKLDVLKDILCEYRDWIENGRKEE